MPATIGENCERIKRLEALGSARAPNVFRLNGQLKHVKNKWFYAMLAGDETDCRTRRANDFRAL
jgi:hypothetical protein